MSYHKMTTVCGYTANGERRITARHGHWSPRAIVSLARRMNLVEEVIAEYLTADSSGKGYGSYDRNFAVDVVAGTVVEVPLTRYQREVNDTFTFDEER